MAHLLEPKKRSLIDILWSNNHSGQKLMEWDNNVYFSTIQSMEKDVNNASLCAVEENDNTIVLYFD